MSDPRGGRPDRASGAAAPETTNDAFDTLMSVTDPPLVVVTTAVEDERAGCLVGFHAQSSMQPHHYCVWLSKANHTYRAGLRAAHFAIHFLTEADLAIAERFGTVSGGDTDKFSGLDVHSDHRGVPVLGACPHRLSVERLALLDAGGDHVCLDTRVVATHTEGSFLPLRLSAAAHLTPGHDNDERAVQP